MFDWVRDVIQQLGYAGIAALTLLENIIPPVPSEVVIPMAGFIASQGRFNFWVVVAVASTGALAGAVAWYAVARSIGDRRLRTWVRAHGRWVTLTPEDLDKAQGWFDRHGGWSVLIGRLIPGVRTFISIPAGFAGMPFAPFLLYSAVGTVMWTIALAWAGTVLERNYDLVGTYLNVVSNVLLGAFLVYLGWRYVRIFRGSKA